MTEKKSVNKTQANGNALHAKARKFIPSGNSLLSKRREMFAPEQWPAYFQSAKGITVTDIDGNQYKDFSHFSVGTNTLGYGNPSVDQAVMDCVKKGNMSTLNPPEEVYLAERLVELHPWASMARFARTGGEANSMAIRIARAATQRSKIVFCGYHGWHDWYLAANLENKSNLDKQLLSGLSTSGVPKELESTVGVFNEGDLDALHRQVSKGDVAAIKMEVMRSKPPSKSYLEEVRKIANDNGCLLIFDECTSGFRETFGGLHLKYGVEPDMSVLGKTLGNGYAITAVLGNDKVFPAAASTFISSTFFTERIGFVAALATLDEMQRMSSWVKISQIGNLFKQRIKLAFEKHGIGVIIGGMDALSSFIVDYPEPLIAKTFITQEMLKRKYLVGNLFYSSVAHTEQGFDDFFAELDFVIADLSLAMNNSSELKQRLHGPVCHTTFERLN